MTRSSRGRRARWSPAARLALLRQAEDVLLEELPVLPIYFSTHVFLKAKSITGYSGKPFGDRAVKMLGLR